MRTTIFALLFGLSASIGAGARVCADDATGRATRAITCLTQRQDKGMLQKRAPLYYRPEQIEGYARALVVALERQQWPRVRGRRHTAADYAPLALAIVQQQSRWVPDAVSRWNRDDTGALIDPGRNPWRAKHPDGRLDYGLFQMHWGTVANWKPGVTLTDLRRPQAAILLGVEWMAHRARICGEWLNARTRPRCGCSRRVLARGHWSQIKRRCPDDFASISCRCAALARAEGGAPLYTGTGTTWSLIGRWLPEAVKCLADGDREAAETVPQS